MGDLTPDPKKVVGTVLAAVLVIVGLGAIGYIVLLMIAMRSFGSNK